jgi:hypothetical protein
MLPVDLLAEVDRLSGCLGVSRSALLTLAANCFVAHTAKVLNPTQRQKSLDAVVEIFTESIKKARKTA